MRSTPEAEGVSSEGIIQFMDAVEAGRNEFHSFVILRHGKIISEGWWSPYGKDLRHVMFSVGKVLPLWVWALPLQKKTQTE
ncbi:MAG: hypothetical protein IPP37_03120 [Saprospiraceae bacterium]|nr:hypothetical protein [Saprospiraceae bacterium]